MESTLAGAARCLFSATSAAAVTCGIMKPELRPGLGVRKAGSRDSAGSTSMAMRRSASEPISQIASAIMSAAKATGSAWKLPPESASPSSAKISGLSETPLASVAEHVGGVAQHVEHGAHHLRLAAQAVGVLHAVVADEVRGADGAAGHQRAQGVGAVDLAAMAAQRVDARIERRVGALGGLGRQRAGDQRRVRAASRPRTARRARRRSRTACR